MKTNFLARISLSLLLSAAGATLIPTNVMAAPANIACAAGVDCLIAGYGGQQLQDWLFQVPYGQAQTAISGSVLSSILNTSSNSLTDPQNGLQKGLTVLLTSSVNTTGSKLLTQSPSLVGATLVAPSFPSTPSVEQKLQAVNSLNPDALMAPSAYTSNEPANANTFIQYVTGLANPPTAIDLNAVAPPAGQSKAEFLKNVITLPDVQSYLLQLQTYAAQQAVAVSNLYNIYNERMPITEPDMVNKINAAITPPPGSNLQPPPAGKLSPLEVQQYLATRRINDANWYASMQNASPAAVDRSILYLLAEFPPMLLQLHLDLERLITTMSVLVTQQGTSSRIFMQQAADKANTAIQEAANPPKPANDAQDQINKQLRQQANQAVQ